MQIHEFSSLAEYLNIVLSVNKTFACHHSDMFFRGVKDDTYPLVPGVIRRGIDEGREMGLVADFMTTFRNYTNQRPKTAFDCYALMQHYGLPTRLLDWSSSPLVALFFSLEQTNNAKTRAVWAITPSGMNEKSIRYDGIVVPNEFTSTALDNYLPSYLRDNNSVPTDPIGVSLAFTNQRVTSQKGTFTLHGFNAEPIDKYYERNGLPQIAKLILKSEEFRHAILNELHAIGMKEDDVYQDLNSLTTRIIREHGV